MLIKLLRTDGVRGHYGANIGVTYAITYASVSEFK